MKHLIKSALALLALLLPTTLSAYDFEVDGIYYNINGNEATVTFQFAYYDTGEQYISYTYSDYCGHVTIPASVTFNGATYPVTTIGEWAFYGCYELTSIEIANSVTSIGDRAFFDCSSLNNIEIPNSITNIGTEAFCHCENMSSISLSSALTKISFGTFTACHNLTNINIPNSVTVIDDNAFCECTGLTSIDVPNSVTSIGFQAFFNCSSLKDIFIPKSVTSISQCILYACWGLESIVVEDGNPNYDSRDNCNAIIETASNTLIQGCKKTIIPNTIISIGNWAFSYCTGLTSINIPNSVTHIGDGAFEYCNSLTNVYSYIINPETVFLDNTVFLLSYETTSYSNRTLHVPIGTIAAYQNTNWSDYFGVIVEMESTPVTRGDVDGDGSVTINDVTTLIDLLLSRI